MGLLQQDGSVVTELAIPKPAPSLLTILTAFIKPIHLVERRAVESAMILCEGNQLKAARYLGLSRTGLRNKLARYRVLDGEAPGVRAKGASA